MAATLSILMEWVQAAWEGSDRVEKQPGQPEAVLRRDLDLLEPVRPWRLLAQVAFVDRSQPGLCLPRREPVVAAFLRPWPVFPDQPFQPGYSGKSLHPVGSP